MKPFCPKCHSADVTYRKKKQVYICEDCDFEFVPEKQVDPLRIFISYGHDEHSSLAERLCNDLKERGHELWFDKEQLKAGQDWEQHIEKALDWLTHTNKKGVMLLLLTPYSVRRPDGYCLNEVARALSRGIRIIPVMLVESEPPLSICKVQWLDMRSCIPIAQNETHYQVCFIRLTEALEENKLDFEGTQNLLINTLNPISFSADIIKLLNHFTGRQWIIREIDNWFKNKNGKKIFWIVGAPGVGKSSISAWIRDNRREISAFHFCDIHSEEKRNPAKLVLSVVYQLSTQLYEYQERLARLPLNSITAENTDAYTYFDKLIIQPLSDNFPVPDRTIVILIDALDEASFNHENEIAKLIRLGAEKTPSWLRFLVTSRPEPEILSSFSQLDSYVLDTTTSENIEDLRLYLKDHITGITDTQIDSILKNSEGVFLYVKSVCAELKNGRLSIDNPDEFPKSLGDIYKDFFDRQFKYEPSYYEKEIRNLLFPILAAYEPLTLKFLKKYAGFNNYTELFDRTNKLGSLFPQTGDKAVDTIKPFHRSVSDWITNNQMAYPYYIDVHYGHKVLSKFGWKLFTSGKLFNDDYFTNHLAAHLIEIKDCKKLTILVTNIDFFDFYYKQNRKHELMRFCLRLSNNRNLTAAFKNSIDNLKEKGTENIRLYSFTNEIAQMLRDMGLTSGALPFAQQSLNIQKEIAGEEDDKTADIYREIAEIQRLLKDFESAFYNYHAALKIYQKRYGENSKAVATIYHDFAEFYRDQNNYDEAIRYNKKALFIRENIFPEDLPALADCINDTGVLISESSNDEDLLPYYERALKLFKQHYGEKHYDIAAVYGNIGNFYFYNAKSHDNVQLASHYFEQAYKMATEFRVLHHPQVCVMRRQLILSKEYLGKWHEITPLQKEEVLSLEILHEPGDLEIFSARFKLASYYEQMKNTEAYINTQLENFRDFVRYSDFYLNLEEKTLLKIFQAFRNTAFHCTEHHKYEDAEKIYQLFLENHFELAGTACHLTRLYLLMGKEANARYYSEETFNHQKDAQPYVLVRILFFKILFELMDGKDTSILLQQINKLLESNDSRLLWTIQPVVDTVKNRLSSEDVKILESIITHINNI